MGRIHPIVCHYLLDEKLVCDNSLLLSAMTLNTIQQQYCNLWQGHLSAAKPGYAKLVLFWDGCSSQYKSKRPMQNIARFDSPTTDLQWNFFGSHHGKGPSDAETEVIKTKIRQLVLSGHYIVDDAKEFYNACQRELTVLDGSSKRHAYYILFEDIAKERAIVDTFYCWHKRSDYGQRHSSNLSGDSQWLQQSVSGSFPAFVGVVKEEANVKGSSKSENNC